MIIKVNAIDTKIPSTSELITKNRVIQTNST